MRSTTALPRGWIWSRIPDAIRGFNFSNTRLEKCADCEPEVLKPLEENSRVKKNKNKESAMPSTKNGEQVSKLKQFNVRDALFEAIIGKFYQDPTLIAFGEDNRDWGGAFGVYGGLTESMPYHRFFNSPISESTIVSSAVGLRADGRPRDSGADVLRLPGPCGRRGL